ncbi:amp-dependent synthetase and ligase [Moniliophthora roreri]|nr:amp-dependent synthetase and ligase [Moniliophthora roreri]
MNIYRHQYSRRLRNEPRGSSNTKTVSVTICGILQRGEPMPVPTPEGDPQSVILLLIPLFHVTGTSIMLVLMHKWDVNKGRSVETPHQDPGCQVNTPSQPSPQSSALTLSQGSSNQKSVPSTVFNLVEKSKEFESLDTVLFTGAPASESMLEKAKKGVSRSTLFVYIPSCPCFDDRLIDIADPKCTQTPDDGTTKSLVHDTSPAERVLDSLLVLLASSGRPLPVNDVLAMNDSDLKRKPNEPGEIWIRGPNVMKAYWDDPRSAPLLTFDCY